MKEIRYKLLKIGTYANTMASIFRSKIEGFEEQELEAAVELDLKVADILIRDIKNEEHDFLVK